jgi:Beta protein
LSSLSDRLSVCKYLPILSLRPAEMTALEELPEADKNGLLPIVLLKRWLASVDFEKSTARVSSAFGQRSWIGDLDPVVFATIPDDAAVTKTLLALADAKDGYKNWCDFVENNVAVIPCLQLGIADEIEKQFHRLAAFGRGIVVRLTRSNFGKLSAVLNLLGAIGDTKVLFVLDYGQANESDLLKVSECIEQIDVVLAKLPTSSVAISATSFPVDFVGRSSKDISERSFFNSVRLLRPIANLIYSDRGSAREERIGGGGGKPAPRVDYPTFDKWYFYRKDNSGGYKEAATELKNNSDVWQSELKIWGTQMIERTSLGDPFGINSAAKSTAARINIHLHNQVYYGNAAAAFAIEEEDWVD